MNLIRPTQAIPNALTPIVSIVVVIFDMDREAKRTLCSLTSDYQEGVSKQDYEVIVVENGSTVPLSVDYVESFGPNFKYYHIENASPSPAAAVNFGVRQSRGQFVGLMTGVIKYALRAVRTFRNPIISTLGWHLGPDVQMRSIPNGYNQQVEDQLLESIEWPKEGHRLFEISALAGSSINGWFMPIAESNCLFMLRETFDKLCGYEESFVLPGGGLVNLDIYVRACELPDSELAVLLGEGSFHQIHGGVSTNVPVERNQAYWKDSEEEYFEIRGKRYMLPVKRPKYIGHIPRQALKWMLYSAEMAIKSQDSLALPR